MTSYRPEIKIRYKDVNCALYLMQLSSAQKQKNRHSKQCTPRGGTAKFADLLESDSINIPDRHHSDHFQKSKKMFNITPP